MGRILSLSLLLCLLLSLLGAPALADDVLRIPTGTTAIEAEAFFGDTSLGEVVLPEGIKTIGANAFACSSVTKINLPKSLVSIDNTALPTPGTVEVTASAGSDAYTWAVGKGYIVPGSVPVNASTFPDVYFRNYVTNNFDTNRDGFLSEAECAVVRTLELMHKGIETLKGVENFPNLYQLRCFDNAITELDLSRNTGLVTLDCAENPLTSLNVSGCTNLGGLYCQETQLTALDVRDCANLAYLWCYQSSLSSLNVSGCANLEELQCQHNALIELDLNGCSALVTLNCSANAPLSTLTLSGCAALTTLNCVSCDLGTLTLTDCVNLKNLNCRENHLTALDVSGLSELQTLYCTSNGMTSLDVLGCAALGELDCAGNALEELELDTLTGLVALTCAANPLEELDILTCTGLRQLFCYDTDLTALDISACPHLVEAYCAGEVYEDEDGGTSYTLPDYRGSLSLPAAIEVTWREEGEVPLDEAHFPDSDFRWYLAAWDTNSDDLLDDDELAAHTALNLPNTVSDLSGLWYLPQVETLAVSSPDLTRLSVRMNAALTALDCHGCALEALDLSGNPDLLHLNCRGNEIGSLDLSQNTALTALDVAQNPLRSLDLRQNTALTSLDCSETNLTQLVVWRCQSLEQLNCADTDIAELDILGLQSLSSLDCGATDLTELNISDCPLLCTAYNDGSYSADNGTAQYLYQEDETEYSLRVPENIELTCEVEPDYCEVLAQELFAAVNQRRTDNNVPALVYCDALQSAASLRAAELAANYSHTRPDGSSYTSVITVPYSIANESIGRRSASFATASAYLDYWWGITADRSNILNASFTQAAVGAYENADTNTMYAVILYIG